MNRHLWNCSMMTSQSDMVELFFFRTLTQTQFFLMLQDVDTTKKIDFVMVYINQVLLNTEHHAI